LINYPFVNTASEYAYNPQPVWAPDGSYGLVAIASEEPFFTDPSLTVWRLPADSGSAEELCTVPGINLFNTMFDRLWNSSRTTFAYVDDQFNLHLALLNRESLHVYNNADYFYGWSADDRYWIYNQAGEIMLAGIDLEPALLEMPEGDYADWFELKWVSDSDFVTLSGGYYDGLILWTNQVGKEPRIIDSGVNSFDAIWIR
jgi:hypothetical protein